MTQPLATYTGLVNPDYRMFEIRDADFDVATDIAPALHDAERHIAGSSGSSVVVVTADQTVACQLDLHLFDEPQPAPGEPWQGPILLTYQSTSGAILVSQGTLGTATAFDGITLPTGAGTYTVAVYHQGREELQQRAADIRQQDLPTDDQYDLLAALDGTERYLIHLWSGTP